MSKEREQRCPICGDTTSSPIAAAVYHFRFIDWPQRKWMKGNFKAFGVFGGLRANLTLLSPFINTLLNWRHRKARLEIADAD